MTYIFVNQISAATASSHAAEVSGLKQSLVQAEEELGQVKKRLEEKQGMLGKVLVSFDTSK
mgnify:CR=1 FL=1